ncbi:helix-turn-helix transcriptional regulator [Oryzicola mucosus]|nr:helix-turn-helix transcriptional regulator [Oryzicola mucosus]
MKRRLFSAPIVEQNTAPLGVKVPAQTSATGKLPDAVRHCRWIATDLNAEHFGVYMLNVSSEGVTMTACFDSNYPEFCRAAPQLAGIDRKQLARHARASTAPCWWGKNAAFADVMQDLPFAPRIGASDISTSGLAFPVNTERGQSGVVVFSGTELMAEADSIHEFHGRCFSLFEAVYRIRRTEAERAPAISRRELECLRLTSAGCTSEEIARQLKLSVHTANQYLTQTAQKLNAVNRMHAVAKALRLGLIG